MRRQQVHEGSQFSQATFFLGVSQRQDSPSTADFSPCKPGVEPFSTARQLLLRCCLAVRVVTQLDLPPACDSETVE